ncbi:MAG: 50S ribosomal protein L18 [Bacteriovoracaceae bacterium]|nr:50S ribosomal protein L18 [Bacteriovoracaceae bacterium]
MRKQYKKIKNETKAKEYRRKLSIRKKINGTEEVPRICVVKSNKNLSVQVINDLEGKTILAVNTFGKSKIGDGVNTGSAKTVGSAVGGKLGELGIKKAVFDRAGKRYTGVIAALADAIRSTGVVF